MRVLLLGFLISIGPLSFAQEQLVDPEFTPSVVLPAYVQNGPVVGIDATHANFHTADGQYRPFAELLQRDGYKVVSLTETFSAENLAAINVLVIANALPKDFSDPLASAFTDTDVERISQWVKDGGSLLFIADHSPFGTANEKLARAFDITMGKGWVFDKNRTGSITTQLEFERQNNSLSTHSITEGRNPQESVNLVRTFTGQSLLGPVNSTVLLRLPDSAREAPSPAELDSEAEALSGATGMQYGENSVSVTGRAQGLAMDYQRGRIVVLGEAGFLSAQLVRYPDGREMRFGMNIPGYDNQQFALNVMHWLSRLLP